MSRAGRDYSAVSSRCVASLPKWSAGRRDQVQTLTYANGLKAFCFGPVIPAELAIMISSYCAQYSNQLFSVQRAQTLSPAISLSYRDSPTRSRKRIPVVPGVRQSFIRTVGFESDLASRRTSGRRLDDCGRRRHAGRDTIGDIGQVGAVMANQIMTSNNIPVAVTNAALGGQPIDFFLRNDSNHADLLTNYGRLLSRLQKAGIAGAVRTILFYQGESDKNDAAHHQTGFNALRSDWLEDYPSLEKLYLFQLARGMRDRCGKIQCRSSNRQRLFADQFPNLSVMSTTGLDGHDG